MFRLDGHVAIVTGGLGRLGSQYARALVTAGASVAVFDIADSTSAIVQGLVNAGQPVSIHTVDVADRAAVDAAVAAVAPRFRTPTSLLHNTGPRSASPHPAAATGPFQHHPAAA